MTPLELKINNMVAISWPYKDKNIANVIVRASVCVKSLLSKAIIVINKSIQTEL